MAEILCRPLFIISVRCSIIRYSTDPTVDIEFEREDIGGETLSLLTIFQEDEMINDYQHIVSRTVRGYIGYTYTCIPHFDNGTTLRPSQTLTAYTLHNYDHRLPFCNASDVFSASSTKCADPVTANNNETSTMTMETTTVTAPSPSTIGTHTSTTRSPFVFSWVPGTTSTSAPTSSSIAVDYYPAVNNNDLSTTGHIDAVYIYIFASLSAVLACALVAILLLAIPCVYCKYERSRRVSVLDTRQSWPYCEPYQINANYISVLAHNRKFPQPYISFTPITARSHDPLYASISAEEPSTYQVLATTNII